VLPTTAAALSLPGRGALTATAARAAGVPPLHPVVTDVLTALAPAGRERHLGRCPEPALLSRRLAEAGAADVHQAREVLRDAAVTTRHIREDGDPQHGTYAPHCRSCAALLAALGVRSVSGALDVPGGGEVPVAPGDWSAAAPAPGAPWAAPGTVGQALAAAGWLPGRRHAVQAERWADALSAHRSPQGHTHTLFPAAFETWAELGPLTLQPVGAGTVYAPGVVVVDPLLGRHWARTLGDLGRALGTELCPLGGERDGTGLLAVDRKGRLYCVDHTGDWYLGPDVLSGLATVLTGGQPHRLIPPDED
jgi:hypothetical protein